MKPHQPRDGRGGKRGRDGKAGDGSRSGKGTRRSGPSGARVVWPPQQRESAQEAIEQLMRDRGLARRFEQGVERAARAARERPRVAVDAAARRDLREKATFTIDPIAARDFDDALSAERQEDGAIMVWVHIADVSAYVREGSPVDVEARERATSVYVPGAVEPMLPEALSSDACSLLPGRERAAVTVELELHGAEVRRTAFYRSCIRSDERLDYDRVDAIFAGREAAREPWAQPLAAAREASAALAQERLRHGGALTLESQEPEFDFDEQGEVSDVKGRAQTESHRLIEYLMIAANEAVARELQRKATPCLYRVHERPQAASVERLVEQLASLGVATPALGAQMSPAQAAELVGEASRLVEAHVQRTIARARGGDATAAPTGGRQALTGLVLRSLQQAYYSPRNLGHAGLGSACYCHFTSPIRRYPDLVCHRALLATLGEPERAPRAESLAELGEWTSQREREAMQAGARRRRRGALLRAGARTAGARPGADIPRRGRRPDRSRRVRRVRPFRGGGAERRRLPLRGDASGETPRGDDGGASAQGGGGWGPRPGGRGWVGDGGQSQPARRALPVASPEGRASGRRWTPRTRGCGDAQQRTGRPRVVGAGRAGHDPARRALGHDATPR